MYTKKTQGYTKEIVKRVHMSLNYDAKLLGLSCDGACGLLEVCIPTSSCDPSLLDQSPLPAAVCTASPSDDDETCPACVGLAMSGADSAGGSRGRGGGGRWGDRPGASSGRSSTGPVPKPGSAATQSRRAGAPPPPPLSEVQPVPKSLSREIAKCGNR